MIRTFGENASPSIEGQRPIITIGMFDGVHAGHREVLQHTIEWAQDIGVPSLAITFDIHPRNLLSPLDAPQMITSLEHRLQLFEKLGLSAAWVLSFTPSLASLDAQTFAHRFFYEMLHAQGVVLGHTARFGRGGLGDIALLRNMGIDDDYSTREIPGVKVNETPVSSTAIREAVVSGDLSLAEAMLGRPVSVLGTVVEGLGVGRELGFPTLNLDPHHELHPPTGVYVTRARCGDTCWNSVTNIGTRPTVREEMHELIETHLLDYNGNLYGQTVEVSFLRKIRDEKKFNNHEALAAQIALDVETARSFFL